MGGSCSSQISCSSFTTSNDPCVAPRGGDKRHHAPHDPREQERIDSEMIAETDELLSDARRHRDRGDIAAALELFVKALQTRVAYLGLNDDNDDKAMQRTIRRLQRAAAANAGGAPGSGSCSPLTPHASTLPPQPQHEAWAPVARDSTHHVSNGARSSGQEHCSDSDASSTNAPPRDNRSGGANAQTRRRATHQRREGGSATRSMQARAAGDSLESSTTSTLGEHTTRTIAKPRAYFHSHVSLLNEIGNMYLRMGNLHLSFFYFFESISILTPVLTASAQAGVKHSGLPSYVDAIIGVTLVYISLAESAANGMHTPRNRSNRRPSNAFERGLLPADGGHIQQEDGGEASGDGMIVERNVKPTRSVIPPRDDVSQTSPTNQQANANLIRSKREATTTTGGDDDILAESIQFAFRSMMPFAIPAQYNATDGSDQDGRPAAPTAADQPIVDADDLKKHGLDPSPGFRASVAALAKRLQGCHPLLVARDQLNEAMAVIQHCDNGRSVYLIPIMHMQCRIALMFDQKKLALHLMQKCLGLTYWYRNGASDAYALAIYSHKSLARIRLAIKRSDAATKIQRWYWRHVSPERCAAHYRAMHDTVNPYTAEPAAPSAFAVQQQKPRYPPGHASSTPQQQLLPDAAAAAPTRGQTRPLQQNRIAERDDPLRASSRAQQLTPQDCDAIAVGEISRTESSLGRKGGLVHAGADFVAGDRRPTIHRTASQSGGQSAAVTYQLPELKAIEGDDALLTLVQGYDAEDTEEDTAADDRETNRSELVHKAKDNVVNAITSLFQTMQRTVSAASFRSSGTPMGMLMGGSGSGDAPPPVMPSSKRSSVAMGSGGIGALSVTSSDGVLSPSAEGILRQQESQFEHEQRQSNSVGTAEVYESPTKHTGHRASTASTANPTTQTSVASSSGIGGYPPTLAQQVSGPQSGPMMSGDSSSCHQRSSASVAGVSGDVVESTPIHSIHTGTYEPNTLGGQHGTEGAPTTLVPPSSHGGTAFGSFCGGEKSAVSDVDLTPESNATGGITRRVGSIVSQAISSTTSPGQRSDGAEVLHDGSVRVPASCDEQQEKDGIGGRRLHEFDAQSVDSGDGEDHHHHAPDQQPKGSNQQGAAVTA